MSMTESEALEILIRDDEEMRKGFFCINDFFAIEVAKKALEEVQQYRAIGTVSEFRELKEKATAKEPILFGDGYADGSLVYDEYNCPNCDENYEMDFEQYDYCPKCGQKLDWSEGKE